MTLIEARDCILAGRGTNGTVSGLLQAIPVGRRAEILNWIGENIDRKIWKEQGDYPAVKDVLDFTRKVGVRNTSFEVGTVFIIIDELLKLMNTDRKKHLDRMEIAGKELSAAEALQWEQAAGKALEWLNEQLANNEISQAQYDESRDFVFNIAHDAHQTAETIVDELALDFLNRDNDWSKPVSDILDEWEKGLSGEELDEPEGPTL